MTRPLRQLSPANRRLQLVMWLAFLAGAVAIGYACYDQMRPSALQEKGATIAARVVAQQQLDAGQGRASYHLTLQFTPPGQEAIYRKQFTVSENAYHDAIIAGSVTLRYLPTDPGQAEIVGARKFQAEPFALGGSLLLLALVVWAYLRQQSGPALPAKARKS